MCGRDGEEEEKEEGRAVWKLQYKKTGFFVLAMSLSVVRVGVDGLLCHTNDGG